MNTSVSELFDSGGFYLEQVESNNDNIVKYKCNIGYGIRLILYVSTKNSRSSFEFIGIDGVRIDDPGVIIRLRKILDILRELVG